MDARAKLELGIDRAVDGLYLAQEGMGELADKPFGVLTHLDAALREVREALSLTSPSPSREQISIAMQPPADREDARAVFPDPAEVPPLVPRFGVVRCGVCGEPLQKIPDVDAYECPQCVQLYDRDKRKGFRGDR